MISDQYKTCSKCHKRITIIEQDSIVVSGKWEHKDCNSGVQKLEHMVNESRSIANEILASIIKPNMGGKDK